MPPIPKLINCLLITSSFLLPTSALAQISPVPESCRQLSEEEIALLQNSQLAGQNPNVVTAETISQKDISVPSLWWAKSQYAPGKLLDNWLALQQEKRITLIVNRQLWSRMQYMERYAFVNKFGNLARDYDYDLQVSNQQNSCLATYTCYEDEEDNQPDCKIDFNLLQGGLRL